MSATARAASGRGPAADEDVLGKAYDARLLGRVMRFVRPHWRLAIAAMALLPVVSLLSLVQPYLFKVAIDDAIAPRRFGVLGWIAGAYLVSLIAEYAARFGQMYAMQALGSAAMNDLRRALYRHLLSLGAAFFDRQPVGRLMTRLTNDVEAINEAFAAGLLTIVGDMVTLGGIVVVMLLLDVRLTVLALAVVPALWAVVSFFRPRLRDAFRSIRVKLSRLNSFLQEHVTGMKVVQALSREPEVGAEFERINREHRDANLAAIRGDAMLYSIVEALERVAVAGLIWYGAGGILRGSVTFGVLVAFIEYVERFFAPIRDLSTKYTVMQGAMASAERIFKLLDTEAQDAPRTVGVADGHGHGDGHGDGDAIVSVRHVSFAYGDGPDVLHDVSLDVRRGETVALVGATGSGKSTLIKLLGRLYEGHRGEIRIDGRDIAACRASDVRDLITVVSQDVTLLSGTVLDNVALWETPGSGWGAIGGSGAPPDVRRAACGAPDRSAAGPDSTTERALVRALTDRAYTSVAAPPRGESGDGARARAEAAARRVGLDLALARRGRTLDSVVGERGANFSAGERQLIAFARALYREPRLLVLDEATASVDPESEALIERGVAELMAGRTCIVIAHRLSTVERADRIVVLHHGRVVESGRHGELLPRGGVYAKLYRLQYVT